MQRLSVDMVRSVERTNASGRGRVFGIQGLSTRELEPSEGGRESFLGPVSLDISFSGRETNRVVALVYWKGILAGLGAKDVNCPAAEAAFGGRPGSGQSTPTARIRLPYITEVGGR
jgi:hypothetical protein